MHIYAGSCSDTGQYRLADWNFSMPPAKYVLSSYTSLKEALNQMLYLITICIIKSNA
jgi:hypothetical protein